MTIQLRDVQDDDLPVFFDQQLDSKANNMAAFISEDPADRAAFLAKWQKMRSDPTIRAQTILVGSRVAGHIARYDSFGKPQVTYWLGREFWGQGIATRALSLFLAQVPQRPLLARAAADNIASIRVLQKCGFQEIGRDTFFANARGAEIEEIVFRLDV